MKFIDSKKLGFTPIELLIAVFILAVGIVGVLSMFPMATRTGKFAQMNSTAIWLGQAKIEELISKSYEDLLIGTTSEPYNSIPNFLSYKRITEVHCVNSNFEQASCDYDKTNDPYPMKKIKVTVFWRSPFGPSEKNVSIIALIAKR